MFDNDRLDHLNGFYIREMDAETWREAVASRLASDLPAALAGAVDAAFVNDVAPLLKERVKKLVDIAEMVTFLFGQSAPDYDGALLPAKLGAEYGKAVRVLDAAFEAFDGLPAADWNAGAIEAAIRAMQDTLDLKLRKYIPTLYVAIMGKAQGIPLFDSLVILGRERTLRRLQIAREMAQNHANIL